MNSDEQRGFNQRWDRVGEQGDAQRGLYQRWDRVSEQGDEQRGASSDGQHDRSTCSSTSERSKRDLNVLCMLEISALESA